MSAIRIKKIFLFSIFSFIFTLGSAQNIIYGVYKNENLFVLNPRQSDSLEYCTDSVFLNGNKIDLDLNSDAYEIDFKLAGIKRNELITIQFYHKVGCEAKILNSEAVFPKSTFKVSNMELRNDSLVWTSTNEHGRLMFYVEQYRWKKWIITDSILGKGTPDENRYSASVTLHSGTNRFRIKQIDSGKIANLSAEIKYESMIPVVEFAPGDGKKTSHLVEFSHKTEYEVYNYFGEFLFSGRANKIDIGDLEAGTYFLKYDNQIASFIRR